MTNDETHREQVLELVAHTQHQRIQPGELTQKLVRKTGFSAHMASELVKKMVDDGELTYTYRDPNSYVEIPCNGCEGGHVPARPMKVVEDAQGNLWLCDSAVEEESDYATMCWDCGSIPFTRS